MPLFRLKVPVSGFISINVEANSKEESKKEVIDNFFLKIEKRKRNRFDYNAEKLKQHKGNEVGNFTFLELTRIEVTEQDDDF